MNPLMLSISLFTAKETSPVPSQARPSYRIYLILIIDIFTNGIINAINMFIIRSKEDVSSAPTVRHSLTPMAGPRRDGSRSAW